MEQQNTATAHHVLPLSLYFTVAGVLFVLTGITVAISFVHFGEFNIIVAMLIATVKASLVALYFMHLKYDNKLFMAVFLSSLIFLGLFLTLTMTDTMHRGDIDPIKEHPIKKEAVFYNK
ncbi:MAG TPA: hypothetical protein ENJ10_08070 [Caldithrix abyssi]|uniref:Cytochrome-c oxidase n=1 Tax=Caldithrix abyssi TaxID=187145 RepID=A0A7V1LMD5_CALAY|nr:hypothetical protein [Caldithrix abyssi]